MKALDEYFLMVVFTFWHVVAELKCKFYVLFEQRNLAVKGLDCILQLNQFSAKVPLQSYCKTGEWQSKGGYRICSITIFIIFIIFITFIIYYYFIILLLYFYSGNSNCVVKIESLSITWRVYAIILYKIFRTWSENIISIVCTFCGQFFELTNAGRKHLQLICKLDSEWLRSTKLSYSLVWLCFSLRKC